MFKNFKTILKHSSVYSVSEMLRKAVSFFMIPVYTHYLLPSDYGILELLSQILDVTAMIVGLRIGAAMVRFYHHHTIITDKQEVFTTALLFAIVLNLFLLILFLNFSGHFSFVFTGSSEYTKGFRIVFICLAIQNIYGVAEAYLITKKKSVLYASLSIVTLVLNLTQNIFYIVILHLGVYGILYSMLVTKTINALIVIPLAFRRHKLSFSAEKLKQMLRFGIPLIPAGFSMFIIQFSDRFFIQRYCSLDDLGLYSLGYKFGMLISILLSGPIFRIWNTYRFEIAKQPDAQLVFSRMFTYFITIITSAGLLLCIFSSEIIDVMASDNYRGSGAFIPLIVMSYIFSGMTNFMSLGIVIAFKTKFQAIVKSTAAILNLVLNYFLITRYGILGAAFSTVLTFIFLFILTFRISQRLYPIRPEYQRILKLAGVAAALYACTTFVHFSLWTAIGVKAAIAALFPILLWAIRFFEHSELSKALYFLKTPSLLFQKN